MDETTANLERARLERIERSGRPRLAPNTVSDLERKVNETDDPEAIRSQIEQTRHHMGRTINEIQARLDPEHLKEQAQEALRDATIGKVEDMAYSAKRKANSWRANLVQNVKQNPVPAAIAGFGLAWLFMSDTDDSDEYDYDRNGRRYSRYGSPRRVGGGRYRYDYDYDYEYEERGTAAQVRDRLENRAEDMRETAEEWADEAQQRLGNTQENVQEWASNTQENVREQVQNYRETAQDYAQNVQETVHDWQETAQERAERLQRQGQRQYRQVKRQARATWQENPLAVGVAAVAAGALFGLLIPTTETENEWMGETRDRLVERAQDVATNTLDKAQVVAQEVAETAQEKAQDVVKETKKAATEVKNEAKQQAKEQKLSQPTTPPVREK